MLLDPTDRGEHDHFASCSAGNVGGICSCERIEKHIERVRVRLAESWKGSIQFLDETPGVRQRMFEEWVISTLAVIVGQ